MGTDLAIVCAGNRDANVGQAGAQGAAAGHGGQRRAGLAQVQQPQPPVASSRHLYSA